MIGVAATAISFGLTIVADWASQKELEEFVKEEVANKFDEKKGE
jgi:hypothetical protein